jgi:hypothetical protein
MEFLWRVMLKKSVSLAALAWNSDEAADLA